MRYKKYWGSISAILSLSFSISGYYGGKKNNDWWKSTMEIRVFNARRIGFIGHDKNTSLSLILIHFRLPFFVPWSLVWVDIFLKRGNSWLSRVLSMNDDETIHAKFIKKKIFSRAMTYGVKRGNSKSS